MLRMYLGLRGVGWRVRDLGSLGWDRSGLRVFIRFMIVSAFFFFVPPRLYARTSSYLLTLFIYFFSEKSSYVGFALLIIYGVQSHPFFL